MEHRRTELWICGLWLCAACADSQHAAPTAAELTGDQSARANQENVAEHTGGSGEQGELPAAPSTFRISLSSGECFGSCPVYDVAIDELGHVSYAGGYCTGQPGALEREVAPSSARGFYDALRAAGYGALAPSYTRTDDCPDFSTDGNTVRWRVEADGLTKTVERYHGCEGHPELAPLDALESELHTVSGIAPWLDGPFNCNFQGSGAGAYTLRVSHEGTALGVLRAESGRSFSFTSCEGAELAAGDAVSDRLDGGHQRLIMLDAPHAPFALPVVGEVGGFMLRVVSPLDTVPSASEPPLVLVGLRADESVSLTVTSADDCG